MWQSPASSSQKATTQSRLSPSPAAAEYSRLKKASNARVRRWLAASMLAKHSATASVGPASGTAPAILLSVARRAAGRSRWRHMSRTTSSGACAAPSTHAHRMLV